MFTFQEIYTIVSVIIGGVLGSVVCFVLLDFKTTEATKKDFEIPYENYYLLGNTKEDIIEYEKQENIDKNIVEEDTPNGVCLMRFNSELNRFEYWSDNTILYKHLEVVARKYVIIYDCKENYVNIFKELLQAINKQKEKVIDEKKECDSVFATLKNYKKDDNNDDKIVNENSNVYKHIGKCSEFYTKDKLVKPIDYKTFKNWASSH